MRDMETTAPSIPFAVRVLRRVNPLVASLLRSPLHGLLSRDVLVLGYTGRRSGRRYSTPISYVEHEGSLYLCTRPEASVWWRNLRGGAEVEIRLRGADLSAHAEVVPSESDEALGALRTFLARNPRTARDLYHVSRDVEGRPDETELAREVRRSVVVRLTRTCPEPDVVR